MKSQILLFLLVSLLFLRHSSAAITNVNVTSLLNKSYNDIWLGVSTGGYDLIGEKGDYFEFRVFVKNGMSDKSINNVEISSTTSPFQINSITPKLIEQIKPMEIRIFYVNVTIPKDALSMKYPIRFDIQSNEFPQGIFALETEIKVVDRIKVELYIIYSILIILILAGLFYRKWKQNKQ